MSETELYYRRHLPHYQPSDAVYHIVLRLAGSLPSEVIERLRLENEAVQNQIWGYKDTQKRVDEWHEYQTSYFEKFDQFIDCSSTGPRWLEREDVASIVAEAIRYRDDKMYDLSAFTIMPNHVHIIASTVGLSIDSPDKSTKANLRPCQNKSDLYPLTNILSSLKKYTARLANKVLGRQGMFWQDESYDHVIRDGDELERTIWYVLHNPVKAKLVTEWQNWKFSYVNKGFFDS